MTYTEDLVHVVMIDVVARVHIDDRGFLFKKSQTRHLETEVSLARARRSAHLNQLVARDGLILQVLVEPTSISIRKESFYLLFDSSGEVENSIHFAH